MDTTESDRPQGAIEQLAVIDDSGRPSMSQNKSEFGREGVLCLLGVFTFMVPSYGFMHCIGTLQSHLQLNQLSEYSIGDVGWIAGLYMFLSYFLNIQIGPVCDHFGPMKVGIVGIASTVASFLLLAECKTYWQFMLCFGVFVAFGGAVLGTLGLCIVAKIFNRRRSLATGIVLTGASLGAIVFPIMLRSTLSKLGWQWSMRLVGFIALVLTAPGLCCIFPARSALKDDGAVQQRNRAKLNFSAIRSPSFTLATLGQFLLEFALFGIAGLLPTVAVNAGFSREDAYLLPAIISVGAIFGRVLPGLLGDIIGPFNTLLIMSSITVVFMSALFIPFGNTSREVLFAFSALWGLGSACFLSITPVCISKICDHRDYGRYFGTQTFFVSFSVLICVPINGIMLDNMGARPLAGFLTGVVLLGGIFYLASRSLVAGSWSSLKVKI